MMKSKVKGRKLTRGSKLTLEPLTSDAGKARKAKTVAERKPESIAPLGIERLVFSRGVAARVRESAKRAHPRGDIEPMVKRESEKSKTIFQREIGGFQCEQILARVGEGLKRSRIADAHEIKRAAKEQGRKAEKEGPKKTGEHQRGAPIRASEKKILDLKNQVIGMRMARKAEKSGKLAVRSASHGGLATRRKKMIAKGDEVGLGAHIRFEAKKSEPKRVKLAKQRLGELGRAKGGGGQARAAGGEKKHQRLQRRERSESVSPRLIHWKDPSERAPKTGGMRRLQWRLHMESE